MLYLRSKKWPGNALIGQSGGPTSVINQTLIGVVESALAASEIDHVYGAIHGIGGILEGQICDFGAEDASNFEVIAGTPSSAVVGAIEADGRNLSPYS